MSLVKIKAIIPTR